MPVGITLIYKPKTYHLNKMVKHTVLFCSWNNSEKFLAYFALFSKCTGVLELKEDTIESLLAAACLLQLSQVIQVCCNFLMKQLHPSNCLGIRSFADAQGCMDLLNVAHNYTMVGPGIQSS